MPPLVTYLPPTYTSSSDLYIMVEVLTSLFCLSVCHLSTAELTYILRELNNNMETRCSEKFIFLGSLYRVTHKE